MPGSRYQRRSGRVLGFGLAGHLLFRVRRGYLRLVRTGQRERLYVTCVLRAVILHLVVCTSAQKTLKGRSEGPWFEPAVSGEFESDVTGCDSDGDLRKGRRVSVISYYRHILCELPLPLHRTSKPTGVLRDVPRCGCRVIPACHPSCASSMTFIRLVRMDG